MNEFIHAKKETMTAYLLSITKDPLYEPDQNAAHTVAGSIATAADMDDPAVAKVKKVLSALFLHEKHDKFSLLLLVILLYLFFSNSTCRGLTLEIPKSKQ